jgi:hypothetical protein
MTKKFIASILAMVVLGLVVVPSTVLATTTDFGIGGNFAADAGLGTNRTLPQTIASIINVALGLLGIVAVVIILIGGFQWMTAGGNEEKATGARKLIFAGIIGLAIILSAYAIARFVLGSLSSATGTGNLTI